MIEGKFDWVYFERGSGTKVLDLLGGTKRENTIFTRWKQPPVVDQRIESSSGGDSERNPVRTTCKILPINWIGCW